MVEPVEIVHVRDHAFVKPAVKPARGKGKCQRCGGKATALLHLGAPQSLNVAGSGGNHFAYQTAKHAWQERFAELLTAAGLPRDLAGVSVEGLVCFPDRHRRDQGNYRYLIEKALGDALVAGGWIEDDDWDRYSFGGLDYLYEKGESWTRLMVFPREHVQAVAA